MPVIDGREVSYNQFRIQMQIRQRNTLAAVDTIAMRQTLGIVEVGRDFGRQELGGFLRQTMTPIVDQFGQVNATAALDYYNETRAAWFAERVAPEVQLSRGARRNARQSRTNRANRFALAKLDGAIYVATKPEFDLTGKVDGLVNYSMKLASDKGFDVMKPALANSLTRALASYQRDTSLYNSGLDSAVVKVQRVARADACSFCRVLAFESFRGSDVRTADYAIDFHDNCHCTIETIYLGDSPIRPDYYDKFEAEYNVATEFVDSPDFQDPNTIGRATGAKDVFSAMRQTAGSK